MFYINHYTTTAPNYTFDNLINNECVLITPPKKTIKTLRIDTLTEDTRTKLIRNYNILIKVQKL